MVIIAQFIPLMYSIIPLDFLCFLCYNIRVLAIVPLLLRPEGRSTLKEEFFMKKWGKILVVALVGILFAAVISYAVNCDTMVAEASEAETVTVNEVVIPNQNAGAPAESQEIEVLEREEPWLEDIEEDRPVQTLPPEIIEPAEEIEEPEEIIDAEPEDESEPEDEVVFEEDESFVDADGNTWYIGKFLDEDNQDDSEDEDEDEYESEDEDEDEESEDEDDFDWSSMPIVDLAPIDFDPTLNYLFSE